MTSQGKALRMTEPILTTNGWVMNKDLKVGDSLCSVDGKPSVVTGIYPQGVKDFYRITFSDGRVADCSGDHLWEINVKGNKHPMVISTLGIKQRLEKPGRTQSMWTPAFEGHCGNHKDFTVHPYILGVLLGDGCLTKGVAFASADEYVVEKCKGLANVPLQVGCENRTAKTYRFSFGHTGHHGEDNPLWMEMKRLGLLGHRAEDKFIPDEYMEADKEQRENLLNGLMDTDGEIDEYGAIHYSSVSERLAKDVQRLCWSLGYKASLNSHKSAIGENAYRDHYRVTIAGDDESMIFTLPRRKERVRVRTRVKNVIQSVEYIGREECQCIKVSHPRELFVMGDYIVTHNTALALTFAYNAMNQGQSVAIYSMEMDHNSIGVRMMNITGLCIKESKVLYDKLLMPKAVDEAAGKLNAMAGNYYVDDKSNTSIDKIIESIRMMKQKYGIVGAVVDYIQILNVYAKSGKSQEQILLMRHAACKRRRRPVRCGC